MFSGVLKYFSIRAYTFNSEFDLLQLTTPTEIFHFRGTKRDFSSLSLKKTITALLPRCELNFTKFAAKGCLFRSSTLSSLPQSGSKGLFVSGQSA